MQENEFEKQVRELMDAFKLSPSESVWGKIEPQIIKQKRKRRWIVLFFLFAGLMVSGYFIYNEWERSGVALSEKEIVKNENDSNENKSNETTSNKTTSNEDSNSAGKKDNKNSLNKNSAAGNRKPDEGSIGNTLPFKKPQIKPEKKLQQKDKFTLRESTEEKNITASSENIYQQQNLVIEDKLRLQSVDSNKMEMAVNKKADENSSSNQDSIKQAKEEVQKKVEEKNKDSDTLNKNMIAFNEDANNHSDTISKITDKQLLKDSAGKKELKKSTSQLNLNRKLQLGITAFYGRSDVLENFLGIKNFCGIDLSKSADAAPGSQNVYDSTQSSRSTLGNYPKSKGAFSFGIEFKKPISKRSSLIAGIHYARLKTAIETGKIKDSAASFQYNALSGAPITNLQNFYTSGRSNLYINRYSFLQIPVIYEYGVTKNNAVNLNAGLSLNRLIGSSVLLYDSYNRVYYSNKSLLRKTQINFVGGVNVKLALNKTTALHLGPQFQYSLSNLSKYGKYDNQHLFSWGLKASLFFGK